MSYLYNSPSQQQDMLRTIGTQSIDDLFDQIPEDLKLDRPLDLPAALSEIELEDVVRDLASQNVGGTSRHCLMGGGVYDHFVPAVVDEIASRGEFYTAYTPYQAEASQGSLQVFFEFQTLVCRLTGLDVANASLYEGATAVSEAVFMSMRATKRHDRIVVCGSLHPEYLAVLRTYLAQLACEIEVVPVADGVVDVTRLAEAVDQQTACVVTQHPNVFGCLESVSEIAEIAHAQGALFVVLCDPISLGVLTRPGDYGADIAVAEGQPLGIPMQYGGPFLGILATRQEHLRKMPGRLIGRTVDRDGVPCFTLNLQAREQHIRREKATSNICTNQGLLALRATVYLAAVGRNGLREIAELCCRKTHYLAQRLCEVDGLRLMFDRPFFREFVVACDDVVGCQQRARAAGYDIGPLLRQFEWSGTQSSVEQGVLVAVTEKRTREQIDGLVQALHD
ncbi:MAG: aminomethyl-transferring glycine dehydrogenase subunit GcvPA [Planctomycetaceae bacterium]